MTAHRNALLDESSMIALRTGVDTFYRLQALFTVISNDPAATTHIQRLSQLGAAVALETGNDHDGLCQEIARLEARP